MRKWTFWFVMCLVSLGNGLLFFQASLRAMQCGIDGVDNQGALLFIPFLWILAGLVLLVLNLYTLVRSRAIPHGRPIHLLRLFRLTALSRRALAGRILFFAVTIALMLFGYALFAAEALWAAAYALTGGLLLLLLYAWQKAGAGCAST